MWSSYLLVWSLAVSALLFTPLFEVFISSRIFFTSDSIVCSSAWFLFLLHIPPIHSFLSYLFIFKHFTGVELIYNVLVSGVQQSESVIHIHNNISTLSLDSFPIAEYCVEFPVLYSRFSLATYFIYSSMCMSVPVSQFIPLPFTHWWP